MDWYVYIFLGTLKPRCFRNRFLTLFLNVSYDFADRTSPKHRISLTRNARPRANHELDKIKQDQTRSTKRSPCISQQTPPIEREHDMPSPKMRGRRCHGAWRLQYQNWKWKYHYKPASESFSFCQFVVEGLVWFILQPPSKLTFEKWKKCNFELKVVHIYPFWLRICLPYTFDYAGAFPDSLEA